MLCTKCGQELESGALFCPVCGTKQEVATEATPVAAAEPAATPVQPAEQPVYAQPAPAAQAPSFNADAVVEKIKKNKKGIIIGAVALVAILIVIAVISIISANSKKNDTYSKNAFFLTTVDDITVFTTRDGKTCEAEGYVYDIEYAADHSLAVYTVYSDNALYYINDKFESEMITDEVYNFQVSYDGKYVAYVISDDGYEGDLYLYSIESGKETEIDSDVYPYNFVLSPNGQNVAYIKNYEGYIDNELYLAGLKKDPVKIDKDGSMPVGVTNNGKYVFYTTDNERLYLFNGKESEKVCSDVGGYFYFNKDLSEVIFTADNNTYYFEPKMNDPVKIGSAYLYDLGVASGTVISVNANNGVIYGTDTFEGCVLDTDNGLLWFKNSKTKLTRIAAYCNEFMISENGKSIIYTMGEELYKIDKLGTNMKPKLMFDEDYIYHISASDDLSKIYVATEEELYYVKSPGKEVRISNDVEDVTSWMMYNDETGKVYFVERDTLYRAGTTEKSKEEIAEDIYYFVAYEEFDCMVYTEWDEDSYEETTYLIKGKEVMEIE